MGMVQIEKKRLAQLESKERAHDDYLGGLRFARYRQDELAAGIGPGTTPAGFLNGYAMALRDLAEGILREGRKRDGI